MAAPSNASGKRRVPIFRSSHEGYGDSRRYAGGRAYSYNSVHGTLVDMRWPGEIREGVLSTSFIGTGGHDNPPVFATEWDDGGGNQVIAYVADNLIKRISAGALSTLATLTTTATGACMHDNGAGIPYLLTCYGGTTTNKIQYTTRVGTITSSTNIYADKMLSIAGDLYISATPTSGTANCAIGKISAGSDPASAAFPTLTRVGHAGRHINNIAAVRFAPVPLKPEGIFSYDRNSDTWINHAPWMEFMPHPDNGKRFWYEGTDLIVGLGTGGAVRFDGYDVTPYDLLPIDGSMPDLDTTSQLVAAAGTLRNCGAVVTQIGAKRQRKGGGTAPDTLVTTATPLSMLKTVNNGVAYTDYSTNISDGDPATVATLDALDTLANGDYILIGHTQPFQGFYLDVSTANANATTMAVHVWDGSAWVAVPSVNDFTVITGATKSLGKAGWVIMGGFGGTAADLVYNSAYNWTPSSINSLVRYWARVSFSAALSATVRIKAVELLPYRPSVDPANFPADGMDRAGCYPHLLLSRMKGDQHIVHDMGTIGTVDDVGAVLHGIMGGTGGALNDDRILMLFGRTHVTGIALSLDDRPHQYSWPTSNGSGTKALVELAAVDMENDVELEKLIVDGEDFQRTGYLYYRFDDGVPWALAGTFMSLPVEFKVENASGRYLHVMPAWTTGGSATPARLPIAPRITAIDADVQDIIGPKKGHLPRITSAPIV